MGLNEKDQTIIDIISDIRGTFGNMFGDLQGAVDETNTRLGDIRDTFGTKLDGLYDVLTSLLNAVTDMADRQQQTLDLLSNFIAPNLENVFHGVIDQTKLIEATACLCPPEDVQVSGDTGGFNSPDDDTLCGKANYYVRELWKRIRDVLNNVKKGIAISNSAIAHIFGFNVIIGIDEGTVPADIRLGLIGLLASAAQNRLEVILNWLSANEDGLVATIFANKNSNEAYTAVMQYIEDNQTGDTTPDIILALKLMFNGPLIDKIYNDSIVWDTSPYSSFTCGEATPDHHAYLYSAKVVQAQSDESGNNQFAIAPALQMITTYGLGNPSTGRGGITTFDANDFVEGAEFNTLTQVACFNTEDMHTIRILYIGTELIEIEQDGSVIDNLISGTWYTFPSGSHTYDIKSTTAIAQFQVEAMKLVMGVWQPLY